MNKVSIHRFARLPGQMMGALGLALGVLGLGAIAPIPTPTQALPQGADYPIRAARPLQGLATGTAAGQILAHRVRSQPPAGLMTVTLYTPMPTCEGYQGVERAIAIDKAIPQIVHYLLAEQSRNLLHLELSGYRIQTTPLANNAKSVTLDLRVAPGSPRQLISLSICEQQALFGSIRKTLLENDSLGIESVQFTETRQPVAL